MPFSATQKVSEGGIVSHTTFQSIKDNLYAIFDALGADAINTAAGMSAELSVHSSTAQDSCLTFFHTFPYLIFGSTGQIIDPTGFGSPVMLSDPDTGYGIYNLESIDWLTYGMIYRVEGVDWAREVEIL